MHSITRNIRWLLLALLAIIMILYLLVLCLVVRQWALVTADAIVSGAVTVSTLAAGIAVIRNYPTKVGLFTYGLFIGMVCGYISWYLNAWALRWWYAEIPSYLIFLQTTQFIRLIVVLLIHCWFLTLYAVRQHTSALEEQFKHISDAASLHREAELFKLRQQLQPHFLYNSLNSINALILIQPDKAQEMIGKLSDFLRNSVKREAREQIPVAEELEYIEAYLSIEAVRFGDRLRVVYKKKIIREAVIPPFLLQPILENAIKFGLYGRTGLVEILIEIMEENNYLNIAVSNPFDPGNRPPAGTGFGLEGIRRRLYLLFARTDLLEVHRTSEVFTTVLKIPQLYV